MFRDYFNDSVGSPPPLTTLPLSISPSSLRFVLNDAKVVLPVSVSYRFPRCRWCLCTAEVRVLISPFRPVFRQA